MDITGDMLKYVLIFIVAVGWVYYRLIRSRRKSNQKHGRERLRERFAQRRMERVSRAETWEERRRLMDDTYAGRRIKSRFLPQDGQAPGSGAADREQGQPRHEPDGAVREPGGAPRKPGEPRS